MLKVEILIVIFLSFAEYFIMEGLVTKKAYFEYEFDTFFEIHSIISHIFLPLWGLHHFVKLLVVENQEYQHFVYRFDIIKVIHLLIKSYLKIAQSKAQHLDYFFQELQILLADLFLK